MNYIIKDPNDDSKLRIVSVTGFKPENILAECPPEIDPADSDAITIVKGVVVFDQAKRDARIKAREDAQASAIAKFNACEQYKCALKLMSCEKIQDPAAREIIEMMLLALGLGV